METVKRLLNLKEPYKSKIKKLLNMLYGAKIQYSNHVEVINFMYKSISELLKSPSPHRDILRFIDFPRADELEDVKAYFQKYMEECQNYFDVENEEDNCQKSLEYKELLKVYMLEVSGILQLPEGISNDIFKKVSKPYIDPDGINSLKGRYMLIYSELMEWGKIVDGIQDFQDN